ncbi:MULTISPECIES: phage tail protein [Rhizobium/Agrobacterium group]|uniref:phage tail protein n=1 Tax=Rhizobium/Agrobacterium group TaxID=227290 RepID=UPI000CDF4D28|nr:MULTISPECIES: phage tail protein [Rhizobium]AVA23120.1 T4-like tail tube protein [Rhizobium sp. NXC24]MBY5456431.1 phage tail protein [Rhizobium leguminosarum]UWU20479.1 phage tail protein [Rhizobium tropici]
MAQEYPLPRFHFQVDWGGAKISFTEVTGLVIEREKIEYRHSDSKDFNKIAMPGLVKNNNITLKRGKFEGDFDYNTWFDDVANDRVGGRRDVVIRLLNEKHDPVAAWSATRCFAVKVTAPDLKSDANEIAVESIEIAHEGLKQMKV